MNDLSLLPGDPIRFFELADGYDRRDLKRAYGKAIRVYKPESHPAEFGRVRDAYERLEKMLRYGKQQQQLTDATDAWRDRSPKPTAPKPSLSTSQSSSSGRLENAGEVRKTDAETLPLRSLAVIDPVAAYRRLETLSRRTPPDYYLAAVLADVIAGKPTAKYLGHLLDGLTAHPSDPGLMNLASEFLRTEIPDAMIAKIVRYVAEKIRSASFYMLTEPLWLRLVDKSSFDQWQPLLETCERCVRQTEPVIRTVFYLRLLRSAVWVAPPEWVERVMGEIESESVGLPYIAEAELEFLSQVRQLVRFEPMVPMNPIRRQLLDAIRLSCQREDPAAMGEVLKSLNELARNAAGMREAFPMASAHEDTPWVMVTYAMVEQIQMVLDDPAEVPTERLVIQVRHLADDLKPHCESINSAITRADWNYRNWPLVGWMIIGTVIGAMPVTVLPFLIFGHRGGIRGGIGIVVALIGIVALLIAEYVFFFRWIYPKFLHERSQRKQRLWSNQAYEKRWRSRLFRYVGSSGDPIQAMLFRIHAIGQPSLSSTVGFFVRQDAGLCVFATLQSLLR